MKEEGWKRLRGRNFATIKISSKSTTKVVFFERTWELRQVGVHGTSRGNQRTRLSTKTSQRQTKTKNNPTTRPNICNRTITTTATNKNKTKQPTNQQKKKRQLGVVIEKYALSGSELMCNVSQETGPNSLPILHSPAQHASCWQRPALILRLRNGEWFAGRRCPWQRASRKQTNKNKKKKKKKKKRNKPKTD